VRSRKSGLFIVPWIHRIDSLLCKIVHCGTTRNEGHLLIRLYKIFESDAWNKATLTKLRRRVLQVE
jgi:hypothetical protein